MMREVGLTEDSSWDATVARAVDGGARERERESAMEALVRDGRSVTVAKASRAIAALARRLARGEERAEETRAAALDAMSAAFEGGVEDASWRVRDVEVSRDVVRALVACAREGCAKVAVSALRAARAASARVDDEAIVAEIIEGVLTPGLIHRAAKVRRAALRAIGEIASERCDRRDLVFALTGGYSQVDRTRRVNYFGALACDPSAPVREEFVKLCGMFLQDDDMSTSVAHAPRVLPYVLSALHDEITEVRIVGEEIAKNAPYFEELVCRNLGDMLLPAIAELKSCVESGWREDIVLRALRLIETMISLARERSTQFIPNVCNALCDVSSSNATINPAVDTQIRRILKVIVEACPESSEYVSARFHE